MKIVTYAIEKESGLVTSVLTVNGERISAISPSYDFADFGKNGDFTGEMSVSANVLTGEAMNYVIRYIYSHDYAYTWTKKIPVVLKNKHRVLHGMKPLANTGK